MNELQNLKYATSGPFIKDIQKESLGEENEQVYLRTNITLEVLFKYDLRIPDYQRIYCWENKQVRTLWKDLQEIPQGFPYHLGAVILQKKNNGSGTYYDIIDGQQRLVTLTLILRALGYTGAMPLLKQSFLSEQARKHIANSKAVISDLCSRHTNKDLLTKISENVVFSVLVLNDENLDLAYTFFSNQNSKGVPLSDYDLLKAHHLRYILVEEQAEHVACQWNKLSEDENLERTLGRHLFRLRKWLRKKDYDAARLLRVKEEFSAAPTLFDIPPFGGQFLYYESIQGGSHFFAYAEHFVSLFKLFSQTEQVKALRLHLTGETHDRYADIIETFLFAYYIKFGEQYLSEALFCITGIMACHRYSKDRAYFYKIREFAKNSEIVAMLLQSSSPTFFFAEALGKITESGTGQTKGIKCRFYQCLRKVFHALNDFSERTIQFKKNEEYE